jgi:hypothetical protein
VSDLPGVAREPKKEASFGSIERILRQIGKAREGKDMENLNFFHHFPVLSQPRVESRPLFSFQSMQ